MALFRGFILSKSKAALTKCSLTRQVLILKDSQAVYLSATKPLLSLFRSPAYLYHLLVHRLLHLRPDLVAPKLEQLPQDLFYKLASYLDVRSITRVLRASTRLHRLERGQASSSPAVFWHTVYMLRPPYKNPGFKLDRVDWRVLLLKKDQKDAPQRGQLT